MVVKLDSIKSEKFEFTKNIDISLRGQFEPN